MSKSRQPVSDKHGSEEEISRRREISRSLGLPDDVSEETYLETFAQGLSQAARKEADCMRRIPHRRSSPKRAPRLRTR